jgi:AGCS family alanine or glycine:cation symporter
MSNLIDDVFLQNIIYFVLEKISHFLAELQSFAWGLPLLILLTGGGIYFLIRSQFLPFKYFFHAINVLRGKYNKPDDPGEISHFKALSTALASTVGMGNIAGVAVAIFIGGPGAIFWMWVSGIIGMATKFFTCTLAVMYRGKDSAGNIQGGPMYMITEGLGKKWKPLAVFFSLAGLIGALPVFNVNQLTQAINDILLKPAGLFSGLTTNLIIGAVLVIITFTVILGGLKSISNVASKLVPYMVVLYFLAVSVILITYIDVLPYYLKLIITDAFSAGYFKGEAFLGGTLGGLILLGIRRGAFSNEAGIGTAPMAHGASKTSQPVREGLVAMLGPFIDTIVICTLTALSILVTGVWQSSPANGVTLTATAFTSAMPVIGNYVLLLCIVIFSVSSLFSYAYYGTKCMSFLIGDQYKHVYNYLYLGSIFIGATTTLDMMINLIDSFFAFMAIPTMIVTIILAPKVVSAAKLYFKSLSN